MMDPKCPGLYPFLGGNQVHFIFFLIVFEKGLEDLEVGKDSVSL